MDYPLLIDAYCKSRDVQTWPRQRVLHECLRDAIRSGKLAAGTRLLASRALASELGVARNSVLYAYDQLATEGYIRPDRRGTVVMHVRAADTVPAAPPLLATISRRATGLRTLVDAGGLTGGFAPGMPALDEFPVIVWRRMLERAWRNVPVGALN